MRDRVPNPIKVYLTVVLLFASFEIILNRSEYTNHSYMVKRESPGGADGTEFAADRICVGRGRRT